MGVTNAALIADGRRAGEGDDWNAPAAAVLESEAAFVEYDLGRSVPFRAGYLQGDNNDEYLVTVSDDGQSLSAAVDRARRSPPRACASARPTG